MTALAEQLPAHLAGYLACQRWFPAKGRPVSEIAVAAATPLIPAGELLLDLCIARVTFSDGTSDDAVRSAADRTDAEPEYFQILVGRRADPDPALEPATIGVVGGRIAYDALWDPEATGWLLEALRAGRTVGEIHFIPEPGARIPSGRPSRVLGVEQSNTSITYGDTSIFKLFRRVVPGLNPDLELHRALRRVGSAQVAGVQGAVEGIFPDGSGRTATLGMLQDYAGNSAEGWAMALASVRDLFAEGDLYASEVGGDFAGEAHRLGETVATVHAELARSLGTAVRDGVELRRRLIARLAAAAKQIPVLAELAPAISEVYASLSGPIPIQRVHGDLHLGQTLRTPYGWLLIDFEGEPAAPPAERARMDSPVRDVAGMLRSFDYAAYHQVANTDTVDEHEAQQLHHRAGEWATRNRAAFCDGYAAVSGADPRDNDALLKAFELDKAVYEVLYETRSRPAWVDIPLGAITRLVGTPTPTP